MQQGLFLLTELVLLVAEPLREGLLVLENVGRLKSTRITQNEIRRGPRRGFVSAVGREIIKASCKN